ncbi:MAG: flavodoxin family protein [Oscillospiraceae bacterium]|nr:flavodoxin family protein [Oscillospiraceae bacterium]
MKKIIVFNGSPRKNGFCSRLLEQVIAGAKSKGAEVMLCDLNEEGVRGCQGCNYCKSHVNCCNNDTMSPALEALRTADGVAASFPIYWGGISGQAKLFLDRLYSFTESNFASKHPGKKFVTVYAQGSSNENAYKEVAATNDGYFKMFGWEQVDTLMAFGGSSGAELPQELLDRAFAAGCGLAE